MSGNTRRGQDEASSDQQKTRIETSWPLGCRELDDLARVAKRIRGNSQRRGEANAYIIRLWSQVLHGEISSTAFWEMFGVAAPAPAPTPPAGPGAISLPVTGSEVSAPGAVPEAQQADGERQARRLKNRAVQADQWAK